MIAPLDWGLGHATRCVPLVKQLMQDNVVLLGVTPLTKPIFDQEFPSLRQVELPPYNISYSTAIPLWLKLLLDSGRIKNAIRKEHRLLGGLIKKHSIEVVISDNRFGLYHKNIHSVFITHQLFLKAPVFQGIASRINQAYIKRFHEVWVPDLEDDSVNLSGELAHGKHFHDHVKYIGPQSRLDNLEEIKEEKRYDYLVLLSGPEPQRTLLENPLFEKCRSSGKTIAFVRGTRSNALQASALMDVFDFPDAQQLKTMIQSSETVICRSGYSTLMDLYVLKKKKLILVPTPGQTEQEYLAAHWQKIFDARTCLQHQVPSLVL